LNPLYESEKIIRYRNKAFSNQNRTPAIKPVKTTSDAKQRSQTLEEINAIRAACWTEPVAPLLTKLKQLDVRDHPDMQRTCNRLSVILRNRSRMPELATRKHFDEQFLACFKKILTLPTRELAILREQAVASFRKRSLRGRGMKMIRLLEDEVPELCQLEREWLDSLKRQKVNRDFIVKTSGYESVPSRPVAEESSGMSWWMIWILISIAVKVISAIVGNSD